MTEPGLRDRRWVRFVVDLLGRFTAHAASFATSLLVLRFVGLADFGLFAVALAVQAAASLGWNQNVLGVVASRLVHGGTTGPWRRYLAGHAVATVLFVAALSGMGRSVFAVAAVVGLVEAVFVLHRPRLMAEGRQDRLALGVTTSQVVRLLIVLAAGLAGDLTVSQAVAAQAPGYLAGAYLQVRGLDPRPEPVTGTWTIGWRAIASDVLNTLVRFGPTTLVFGSVGSAAAGAFDVVVRGAYLLGEGIASLGVVDLPSSLAAATRAQQRARQRATVGGGLLLATLLALAYGFAYPTAVERLADASISQPLAWSGAVAMAGIAMFGLSRTLLWDTAEGHQVLILTQVAMCGVFGITFAVATVFGVSTITLAAGYAGSWLIAAMVSVYATGRLLQR